MRLSSLMMLLGGGALAGYGLFRAWRGGMPKVEVKDGVLRGPQGSTQLDEVDALWLARAAVGESGGESYEHAAAVIWCLAQNHTLVRRQTPFARLYSLVRAYSQPCNPEWADASSSKCASNPTACTPSRVARRQEVQTMPWSSMPDATRRAATDFLAGRLTNPVPGCVDFLATRFPGATVQVGSNWFGVASGRTVL